MTDHRLLIVARLLFVFAALWSLGTSGFLLLSPVEIHEMRASSVADGAESLQEVSKQASWYEVQGVWGVVVLFIFAALFASVGFFAIKGQRTALAVTSALSTALSFLAGFSVGPLYLPAVLAVLLAWVVLGITSILRRWDRTFG